MDSQEDSRRAVIEVRLQSAIANLLRGGVLASATLVGVAGLFYLWQHRANIVNYGNFQLERSNLRTVSGIFAAATRLRADALIQIGTGSFDRHSYSPRRSGRVGFLLTTRSCGCCASF
jgi:hypothetical protein